MDGEPPIGLWMTAGTPGTALRPFVRRYVGYTERPQDVERRRQLPHTGVVVVLGWGDALRVRDPRRPTGPARRHSFVAGLHDSYVEIETSGTARGLQFDLTPIGAHRLLGLPMREVANRSVALDDLLGGEGADLVERIAEATTWDEGFAVLDRFLHARLAAAAPGDPRISWVWDTLVAHHGQVAIGSLAAELGWSRRHLIDRFRSQVGLAPKTVARLLRFEQASRFVAEAHDVAWAEVAVTCGYYDQSHLNREFRAFAGATPPQLLAERLGCAAPG